MPASEELIVCSKCRELKPESSFGKEKRRKSGRSSRCKDCHNAYYQKYFSNEKNRKKHVEAVVKSRRKTGYRSPSRLHGMSQDEYQAFVSQGCAICGDRDSVGVDHDHSCCPGQISCGECVRGPLCRKCNSALGMIKEDVSVIDNLISYVVSSR